MIAFIDLLAVVASLIGLAILVSRGARGLDLPMKQVLGGLLVLQTLYLGSLGFEWQTHTQAFDTVENVLGALLPMGWAFLFYALIQIGHNREIRTSERWHRVTLDSIGDAVIATDKSGRVMRMNPVAEDLTGWTADQARDRPVEDVFNIVNANTRQTVESPVKKVLATGRIVGLANHTVLISRTGQEYQIADSGAPIGEEGEAIQGVVLVFRDVTQEYAIRDSLHQSQKMSAIGRLASGVAHDFNNMLGGILGATDLLQDSDLDDPEADQYLDLIRSTARRAADLAAKLLAFSRKQPVVFRPLDVNKLLGDTVSLLEQTVDRRIKITLKLDADDALITGDTSSLQNVFLNLGINAAHAMPDGGVLTLQTRCAHFDAEYCELSEFDLTPGRYLIVEVRDTGCGIAPEHLKQVFEPFFTTREKGEGTGLGLSAAHGSVDQHGGAITVYSELGRGTVFHVALPLSETGDAVAEPEQGMVVSGRGLILLVDDEEVIRITGGTMLKRLGYEVETAADGVEALDCLGRRGDEIQLVLLDMVMPRMSGRECYEQIRRDHPEVPVVLASGFTPEQDLQQLLADGVRGFLQKPYQKATLSRAVAAAINASV